MSTPTTPLHSDSPPDSFIAYHPYNSTYSGSGGSPTHVLPSPPGYPDYNYPQSRSGLHPSILPTPIQTSPTGMAMSMPPSPMATQSIAVRRSRGSQERREEEVRALKARIRELEQGYRSAREKIKELEAQVARATYGGMQSSGSALSSPISPPSVSESFNEEWRARTEARVKLFCSLNRAGNALCAWHDSRRERRAHPPRMAPPGRLNCDCTYEQALFEESLSRHGVGSYHPGENVRMDPAIRNPLLRLLEDRYGYRDGDFERDPRTGEWVEGEGPQKWESKAAQGGPASKKIRLDDRR